MGTKHVSTSNADLLQKWHSGERSALEELIRRHLPWIQKYVRSRMRHDHRLRAETHDVVQEAVIDVLEYGPRFQIDDEDCFRGLLARIVENNLVDQQRSMRRACRDVRRERAELSETVLALDPPRRAITIPPAKASRAEAEEWVRLAIELLDARDREVILLREWDKESFEEIGRRLDIPANTARMRFQRAMPRLVRKVEELRSGRVRHALLQSGASEA